MKRLHIHVAVEDLDRSIGFYSTLFATRPSVVKDDYAKWMLDDPRVNFAISARGAAAGVDHIGIQVESAGELADIAARLQSAGEATLDQQATTCCYARSDKSWVTDPSGVRWESFHTLGDSVTYGEDAPSAIAAEPAAACCAAAAAAQSTCC